MHKFSTFRFKCRGVGTGGVEGLQLNQSFWKIDSLYLAAEGLGIAESMAITKNIPAPPIFETFQRPWVHNIEHNVWNIRNRSL